MEALRRFSFRLAPISLAEKCLFSTSTTGSTKSEAKPVEALHRFSLRLAPITVAGKSFLLTSTTRALPTYRTLISNVLNSDRKPRFNADLLALKSFSSSSSSSSVAKDGWFLGFGKKNQMSLPDIVKAGDPVLHEPAQEVDPGEIGSERIQKIIDDMIKVMRKARGVGLAAPQIGIPLRIIVLEDTKEYISYASKELIKAQDRRPFDLLVIVNPKLEKKSDRTALFFEGCLSVEGHGAVVERCLDVEVAGFDRDGKPIKIKASGWQARILQHECDHLDGTLYVDKMVPKTFRNAENSGLPLAQGCPKLGAR